MSAATQAAQSIPESPAVNCPDSARERTINVGMPHRGKGNQPKVGESASLPWVNVDKESRYPEWGCGGVGGRVDTTPLG